MATNLNIARGQRLNLTDVIPNNSEFELGVTTKASGLVIDFSCFGLDLNGKLSDESYMTFFNFLINFVLLVGVLFLVLQ